VVEVSSDLNVVPEDLYRRFNALKDAFASRDHELDRLRPWAAAVALRDDMLESLSLTNTAVPRTVLRDASWRAKVITVVTYADIAVLERNSRSPRTVSCLEKMVSDVETDRDDLKVLANAWSVGDIEALRELQKPDECFPTLFDSDQQAKDMAAQHTGQWLATAVAPDSWLTALRAQGYRVDGPRWQ
jgi:hypothetical protein